MKATLKRLISSSTTTIVLLLVYGAGLAIATFIEKYQGSEVARSVVYCSPLFFLLQFLIVLNWLAIVIRQRSLKMQQMGNVSYSRGFHSNSAGSIGISSLW